MLRTELRNITRDNLLSCGKISVRSYNVCANAELYTLEDILSFYEHEKTFLNIRNAGSKTCIELQQLCDQIISGLDNYQSSVLLEIEIIPGEILKLQEAHSSFNKLKIELFEKRYRQHIEQLDVRSKNAIIKYDAEDFYCEFICNFNSTFITLRNVGKKTINELNALKIQVKNDIIGIAQCTDKLAFIEILNFRYGDLYIDDFVLSFYDEYGCLPMFWILQKKIELNNNREVDIFKSCYQIFQHQKVLTLNEVAEKYLITRERARQIRILTFENLFSPDSSFFLYKEDWQHYELKLMGLDVLSPYSPEIKSIINNEHVNFNNSFILQIFPLIFPRKYTLLGGFKPSGFNQEWNSIFLVNSNFSELFDFLKFKIEISELLSLPRINDKLLDLNEFLLNCFCWKIFSLDKIDEIISITREILAYEFSLFPDLDGYFIIPKNSNKHTSDVVYDILEQYGNSMHIDDIFLEFKKLLPDHKYKKACQLRSTLQLHSGITFVNRSSTYALTKWGHIKTGTIRNAIVEFLKTKDIPQSDDAIANYVLGYFPKSNIASIRTSMYNDKKQRFVYFEDGSFGLFGKEYPTTYKEIEKRIIQKSFDSRLYDLEKFLQENDHFPFSTSQDINERALYRWWSLAIRERKYITENQIVEVERIKAKYVNFESDRNHFLWNENYTKFKIFILENRRFPNRIGNEKCLYSWWRRNKADYLKNKLSNEQRTKYIQLLKLI